jgi:hypothetical protein
VLERLTSILCVSFARCLRIFEAVASTENYQTFLPPEFNVVAEPAIRSRLKVEVFVYEIVATLALPEQSAFDWCPYFYHKTNIYNIYNKTRMRPFAGNGDLHRRIKQTFRLSRFCDAFIGEGGILRLRKSDVLSDRWHRRFSRWT